MSPRNVRTISLALAAAALLASCADAPPANHQPAPPPPIQAPSPPPNPKSEIPSPKSDSHPTSPSNPQSAIPNPQSALREVFPHIRLDAKQRLIELDGTVPIDAHSDKTPRVYLEVCVCTPDSKEHETLAVTKALPSNLHAALLLLNLQPGKPGAWNWEGPKLQAIPATGAPLAITVAFTRDGRQVEEPITDWVIDANTHQTLTQAAAADHWVFAGSRIVQHQGRDWYAADGDGTMIGLTTFGGETIAWTHMYNPDSGVESPHWIANAEKVPAYNTPVTIRIRPANN